MFKVHKLLGAFKKNSRSGIADIETTLGYNFSSKELLIKALSHRSYIHIKGKNQTKESNERLEFLGDAVLGLVITEHLYLNFTEDREGKLSKMKSVVVSAKVLSMCAKAWGLGQHILMSAAEKKNGGRDKESILADAYEAVLGAVYLDGGLEKARALIHTSVVPKIEEILEDRNLINYKSLLLEYAQSKGMGVPVYHVLEENGPEHEKLFRVAVKVNGSVWGKGEGTSKKAAEQIAARYGLKDNVKDTAKGDANSDKQPASL